MLSFLFSDLFLFLRNANSRAVRCRFVHRRVGFRKGFIAWIFLVCPSFLERTRTPRHGQGRCSALQTVVRSAARSLRENFGVLLTYVTASRLTHTLARTTRPEWLTVLTRLTPNHSANTYSPRKQSRRCELRSKPNESTKRISYWQ